MKSFWFKVLGLFGWGLLVYLAHRYVLSPHFLPDDIDYLNFSYGFNALISILFIINMLLVNYLDEDFPGFALMLMGVLKIILFVVLANKYDYPLERKFFLHIFAPYTFGQIIEIYALTQIFKLNKTKSANDLQEK